MSKLTADGREVTVTWSAEPDDLVALGRQVGAVTGSVVKADQGRVAGTLDGLPEVAAYLAEHLAVSQDGTPCLAGDVDTTELGNGGARLGFTCAAKVDRVEFTVTALTDIDRAYRNVSVTSFGKGALHGVDDPTHLLSLTGGSQTEEPDGPLLTTDLTQLLSGRTPLLLGLLIACLVGAAHACAPGHGKTLTAAYLVGGQGTTRDAVWLGAVVAGMHTFTVAVLAIGWWALAETAPDLGVVTRWLQLARAVLVLAVGIGLVRRHTADRGELVAHGHGHGHGRGHGHGHAHGEHSHVLVEPRDLLTRRGLVLIGTSGGVLPSPSAFLVLLVGLLTGHVLVAVAMVVAFGVGMALTLTFVGLLVLRGRDALVERATRSPALQRWTQRLPLLGAVAIVVGGTVATVVAAAHLLA